MSPADDRNRGSIGARARAVLGATSLVVLGAVLGIVIDRHLLAGDRPSHAVAFHEMAMTALGDRLDLTAAQQQQIDSILRSRHHTLRQTWHVLHEQLGAAVDTVHHDIEAVLTPEQREEFRAWLRDWSAGE